MIFGNIFLLLLFLTILGSLVAQAFIPGFPKETLLLQSGISFGLYLGSFLNWLGMVLAAQVAYEVVRRSVETGGKYSELLKKYQNMEILDKLNKTGNSGLFILRLLPFSPNDILSLLAGALKLPRKGFFLVSIITAIPYAVIFAYFGSVGTSYIDRRTVNIVNICILCISIIVIIIQYFRNRPSIIQNISTDK